MAYKQSPFPLIQGTSPVKQLGLIVKGAKLARKVFSKAKKAYTKYKRGKPLSTSTEHVKGHVTKKTVDYKNTVKRTFYNTDGSVSHTSTLPK